MQAGWDRISNISTILMMEQNGCMDDIVVSTELPVTKYEDAAKSL